MANNENSQPGQPELYASLMAHALHQDRILWSRVQLLIAVQGAVLYASYVLREHWLGKAIILGGALLTILMFILVRWDSADRDANQRLMDNLAKEMISADVAQRAGLNDDDKLWVRFTAKRTGWRLCFGGRSILHCVMWAFAGIDVFMFFLYVFAPQVLPATTGLG